MVTGFDYLAQDKALQEHWVRRAVAIVIDSIIIFLPISVLFQVLGMMWYYPWWWFGIFLFLYAAFFDSAIGGTVGKMLMGLKAVPITGQMTTSQVFIRNVTKVFAPVLLLDWIIGMAIDTKDPRQKWTDTIARTSVIKYGKD
jgi:uncharacterized RDD family membrane protein YckC